METKFEKDNVVTYEVFTNKGRVKEFLYATDTLDDLTKVINELAKEYQEKEDD